MKKGSAEIILLLPLLVVLLFTIVGLMPTNPNVKLENTETVGMVIGLILIMVVVCFCAVLIPAMARENKMLDEICSHIASNCKKEKTKEKK